MIKLLDVGGPIILHKNVPFTVKNLLFTASLHLLQKMYDSLELLLKLFKFCSFFNEKRISDIERGINVIIREICLEFHISLSMYEPALQNYTSS